MPDIFVPGVKSRFDTEKIVSGLMAVERIPRDRLETTNDTLAVEKESWQDLGRRITSVRENARSLFSHQNPFNERAAVSSDDSILSATSTREAKDQEHTFIVKQVAKADRLLSDPIDKNYRVPAGNYAFSTGKNEVSFNYKGGTVQDFAETINRRSNGKLKAGTIAAQPGTNSFVIESLDTGAANKLTFAADALSFAVKSGIIGEGNTEPKLVPIKAIDANNANLASRAGPSVVQTNVQGDALRIPAMGRATVSTAGTALGANGIVPSATMMLKFETQVTNIGGLTQPNQTAEANQGAAEADSLETADAAPALDENGNPIATRDPSVFIATEDALDGDVVEGKYATQRQRAQGALMGGVIRTLDNAEYLGQPPVDEDAGGVTGSPRRGGSEIDPNGAMERGGDLPPPVWIIFRL